MNKAGRDALEARLGEQLGMRVIIDVYTSEITLFDLTNNPYWRDERKIWLVLPVDVASTLNASQDAKNVIQKNLEEMKLSSQELRKLESLRSQA